MQSSCEGPAETVPNACRESTVLRYQAGNWDGIPAREYKTDTGLHAGVTRRVLAAPETAGFETRYFEVEEGGYTTHERHEHVHVVICLRGRGRVRLGDRMHQLRSGDAVYVAPGEPHQFLNTDAEPFGFLCIVDRDRDRPVPIEDTATEEDHALAG